MATAPIGFAVVDHELRYLRINETLAALNGKPVEAHLGRTVTEILPETGHIVEPLVRRVLETGEPILGMEGDLPIEGGRGRFGHLLISYFPVRVPGDERRAVGAVIVDITEQKRAREELERDAAFRERFIGVLGHDLRTPLSAIVFTVATLLRQEDISEGRARAIRRVASSAHRMERMITDLLDFTRSRQGGGIPIVPASIALDEVCRHVLDEVAVTIPDREVALRVHGDCRGRWDPDRVAQVVSNLVVNALDYSPPETPVHVTLEGGARAVRLTVHNEGAPIPPDVQTTLFDPFRRAVQPGEGRAGKGLGLGLYIVSEIVRAHRGEVRVESEAGRGTTFTVELPRA
jgi:PAS domain S-box-containing protein